MSETARQILIIIVSGLVSAVAGGGFAVWLTVGAKNRRSNAESDKLTAEANKIGVEADSIRFETWQQAFSFLRERNNCLQERVAALERDLRNKNGYIRELLRGIHLLIRQIEGAGKCPVWDPPGVEEFVEPHDRKVWKR